MIAGFVALAAAALPARLGGHRRPDDIGGVVTGPHGPEAGVWVIAETNELPTKFVRIVVTDDQGRYLIPDLPKASYSVWVRGYGLVDSPKSTSTPGSTLEPHRRARARMRAPPRRTIPPATGSRCSKVPDKSEFPGTGPAGQRHLAEREVAGRLDPHDQVGDVHGLPPARQQRHARDPDAFKTLPIELRAVGAARAVRARRARR